ncbi:MAG: hypothetical protein PCFJNLEI_00189 [Verrucomicrobiae bacterium]|nr:hypothetical protein [Verrucomicrobiae bacterium]
MSFFLIGADDSLFELPANKNVLIGRAGMNQIVLNDRLVSRVHARISPSANGPLLTDRGSANGVQVNGRPAWETVLHHGDSVQIGKTLFHVFAGTQADAQRWIARRRNDTKSDRTMTGLNVNQFRPTDMLGDLAGLHIVSLLQTLVSQQQQGALTLTQAGELVGKIYFVNGTFAYAETVSGLKNKDALFALMQMQQGQFVFQLAVRPPTIGIQENAAALILEGCQRLDEKHAPVAV